MAHFIGSLNMAEILTNTGLRLPEHYTEDEFFAAGRFLASIERGSQWAIGDWYNAIPWGDKEKACEVAGLNYKTARDAGIVCAAFSDVVRNDICTFDHHRRLAIQDLSTERRAGLLAKSAENGWTVARLVKERDALLGKVKKDKGLSIDGTFEKVMDALPKSASTKVKKALEEVKKELQHDFSDQVIRVAKEKAKDEIEAARAALERAKETEAAAAAAEERFVAQARPLDGWMTKEEFQLIRGCLHPDQTPSDFADFEARKERYTKAFNIFMRMEGTVSEHIPIKVRRARGWA
jgi:hypothetical protein